MLISELIRRLNGLIAEHGDHEIGIGYDYDCQFTSDGIHDIEFYNYGIEDSRNDYKYYEFIDHMNNKMCFYIIEGE